VLQVRKENCRRRRPWWSPPLVDSAFYGTIQERIQERVQDLVDRDIRITSEELVDKGKVRVPIDGVRAGGWIRKCEEDMDNWIKKFWVKCSGTVKNLQCNSTKAYSDGKHYDNITAYAEDDLEGEGVPE
jgi:hypothetical protein